MYNYTEFRILESGNAAGKGGEYPTGDYCVVENFREEDNIAAKYQQKVLVCAPEALHLSGRAAGQANIPNLAIMLLIRALFV